MHIPRKFHKILLPLFVFALIVSVVSQNSLSKTAQTKELDRLFAKAYTNGEITVDPIIPTKEFWRNNVTYGLANLIEAPAHKEFKGGEEYVLERLDSGAIIKVTVDPKSEFLNKLSNKAVVVEANITFEGAFHESKTTTADSKTQIQNYVKLPEAYRNLLGQESTTTVAVVDSGFGAVDSFASKLAVNEAELSGEAGKDDDNNGYIDDTYGWNFLNQSAQVGDLNGHGTHLSGIVMAMSDAKILPLQALDANNSVTLDRLLAAINYAIEQEVDVINLSIGSTQDSTILKKILAKAEEAGISVVASAGNYNQPVVLNPAAYHSVVGVATVYGSGDKTYYSNYGPEVDVSYRGLMLSYGTDGKTLVVKEGTSQAAAAVSALLATIKQHNPELTPAEQLAALQNTGQKIANYPLGFSIDLAVLAEQLQSTNQ